MTLKSKFGLLPAIAAIPLTALALSACGGSDQPDAKTASGASATLGVATAGDLGKILVDSQGRTLYLFAKDAGTKSECSGACAEAWPPLRAKGHPAAGGSLSASKLGTTARQDGAPQVTYNGHPLYLYSGDESPGETNGQGLNAFGASWFVVSPSGNQVSGAGSNPGGGY